MRTLDGYHSRESADFPRNPARSGLLQVSSAQGENERNPNPSLIKGPKPKFKRAKFEQKGEAFGVWLPFVTP